MLFPYAPPASIRPRPFARLHSPAFPVVADGAKDVVAAPVIIPPRGDQATARQWPPASPRDHAGQRMAANDGYPGAGPARPASALTPACLRWWRNLSFRTRIPADRNVNQHPGANSPGPETSTPHFYIPPAQISLSVVPRTDIGA